MCTNSLPMKSFEYLWNVAELLMLKLLALAEEWPISGDFVISRGAKTSAHVVVAKISDGTVRGRGECVPYGRYGETVESVSAQIRAMEKALAEGIDHAALQNLMPAGAARNALDCAFFDLRAKQSGQSAAELAGLPTPIPQETAYTISLGSADAMARDAREAGQYGFLKLKLGGHSGGETAGEDEDEEDDDAARMLAVRAARPTARLIADANEAWRVDDCTRLLGIAHEAGFELIEQPLPRHDDGILAEISHPVPVCADESVHKSSDLSALRDRYDAVNIKLDKTGGLTEAIQAVRAAKDLGFSVMLGCMVCTSLSIAPAFLLSHLADWVDLDGPLLLAQDRPGGIRFEGGKIAPVSRELWG